MMTKEDRKALAVKRKELREKLKEKYGIAIMDEKKLKLETTWQNLQGYSSVEENTH